MQGEVGLCARQPFVVEEDRKQTGGAAVEPEEVEDRRLGGRGCARSRIGVGEKGPRPADGEPGLAGVLGSSRTADAGRLSFGGI